MNLDAMTAADLDAFASDQIQLVNYATSKACAIRCRKAGYIERALQHEGDCDRIYNRLPEKLRW